MDRNRVIGLNNGLPWRLPADLRHFKETTMGHAVIMGRKTWESIAKPLPGRHNIVITSQTDYCADGVSVTHSLEQALQLVPQGEQAMIIGGAKLYEQSLPLAQRIYLTQIHACLEGDTWFPPLDEAQWKCASRQDFQKDEKNQYDYSFLILDRI